MNSLIFLPNLIVLSITIGLVAPPPSTAIRPLPSNASNEHNLSASEQYARFATDSSGDFFEEVDVEPSFDYEELLKSIRYPDYARRHEIQGIVYVKVLIDTNGTSAITIVDKSVEPSLDAEAQRAVASFKRWTPAILNGKPVARWMTVPISFRIRQKPEQDDL